MGIHRGGTWERFRLDGAALRVWRTCASESKVLKGGLGFRVQGLGFRVQGLGFRVVI